jgi:hypothetical protein
VAVAIFETTGFLVTTKPMLVVNACERHFPSRKHHHGAFAFYHIGVVSSSENIQHFLLGQQHRIGGMPSLEACYFGELDVCLVLHGYFMHLQLDYMRCAFCKICGLTKRLSHNSLNIATVLGHNSLNIAFRRNLTGDKWNQWLNLVSRLMEVQLSPAQDIFRWNLTASGEFSVKSMYLDFMNGNTIFLNRYIWKIKVPLKIRIFMWFLHRKVILTKDNLLKQN